VGGAAAVSEEDGAALAAVVKVGVQAIPLVAEDLVAQAGPAVDPAEEEAALEVGEAALAVVVEVVALAGGRETARL
jgi:hypothetical protein